MITHSNSNFPACAFCKLYIFERVVLVFILKRLSIFMYALNNANQWPDSSYFIQNCPNSMTTFFRWWEINLASCVFGPISFQVSRLLPDSGLLIAHTISLFFFLLICPRKCIFVVLQAFESNYLHFYIQSFWLNMLQSNPGCVSVCLSVCVCVCVCVISTA